MHSCSEVQLHEGMLVLVIESNWPIVNTPAKELEVYLSLSTPNNDWFSVR